MMPRMLIRSSATKSVGRALLRRLSPVLISNNGIRRYSSSPVPERYSRSNGESNEQRNAIRDDLMAITVGAVVTFAGLLFILPERKKRKSIVAAHLDEPVSEEEVVVVEDVVPTDEDIVSAEEVVSVDEVLTTDEVKEEPDANVEEIGNTELLSAAEINDDIVVTEQEADITYGSTVVDADEIIVDHSVATEESNKSDEEIQALEVKQLGETEEEVKHEGAYNPDTGEINWDCPCLGGMAQGPCGEEFKEAFACFVYSEAEPKGIDCVEKFKHMQDCFRRYPEHYAEQLQDEEEAEQLKSQSEDPAIEIELEKSSTETKSQISVDDI